MPDLLAAILRGNFFRVFKGVFGDLLLDNVLAIRYSFGLRCSIIEAAGGLSFERLGNFFDFGVLVMIVSLIE